MHAFGVCSRYGVAAFKIARIEDGLCPADVADGVVLSVPTNVSADLVHNISVVATSGAPVVLLGRCTHIATSLLALAGVERCDTDGVRTYLPPYYGAAVLVNHTYNATVSVGRYARVVATAGVSEPLVTLGNGDVIMTQRDHVVFAQLNDYTSPVTANLAVANYGDAMPHYVLATRPHWRSVRVVGGLSPTQPASVHVWAVDEPWGDASGAAQACASTPSRRRLMLLVGNLDANFCGGPCSVPAEQGTRSVTVEVDTALAGHGLAQRWLLRALSTFAAPVVLYSAGGSLLNVSVTVAFKGSAVYSLEIL